MRRRRTYRRMMSKRGRWQSRARRMVGNPRNYSTSKTTESINPGSTGSANQGRWVDLNALDTKTVRALPLIQISGTASNSINARQRDMCVISGVKIEATFRNNLFQRIYVNWAVIHGKQGQVISDSTADFFRDYQQERTFDAGGSGHLGKTGLTSAVAQINTDEFVVLKRGKFMLCPDFGGATRDDLGYNYGAFTKEKSIWCKLGRSFYFDDGVNQPQDQIFFVVWPAIPEEATATETADALDFICRAVVYWREPRSA